MRTSVVASLGLLLGMGLVAACSVSVNGNGNVPDGGSSTPMDTDGGTVTGDCPTDPSGGTGTYTATIGAINASAGGTVTLTGATTVTVKSGESVQLASGLYKATASIPTVADPIVRTVYATGIALSDVCIKTGQTSISTAGASPLASSGKLWTTNNSPSGQLLGFASATLATTGTPAATVAAKGPFGTSLAFDRDGNLWSIGAPGTTAAISRYPAQYLGASTDQTADRVLTIDPGCAPGFTALAFAPADGALWVSSACGKKISRLAPTDLAATGAPTAGVVLGGLNAPEGVAFDKLGNMWVADSGAATVLRYDAARLTASSNDLPSAVITPKTAASADLPPNHLAFDKNGNLWASSFGGNVVYMLTAADQSGAGAKALTPSVQVTLPVDALLEGMAFDESGAMWLTLSAGKIGRVSATQLATTTTAAAPTVPEVIVTSADIGSAASLAFFPAPAALPIYSALP